MSLIIPELSQLLIPSTPLLIPAFIPGWINPGRVGLSGKLEGAYVTTVNDINNLTTYTFSGTSLGSAHPKRSILCTVSWRGNGGDRTISSASIGGQTATTFNDGASNSNDDGAGAILADVPSGSTGTISITMSGACFKCTVHVYRILNMGDKTGPHDAATDILSDVNGVYNASINVPEGGFVLGVMHMTNSGGSINADPTGFTQDYFNNNLESNTEVYAGSVFGLSSETGRAVDLDTSHVFQTAMWWATSWS